MKSVAPLLVLAALALSAPLLASADPGGHGRGRDGGGGRPEGRQEGRAEGRYEGAGDRGGDRGGGRWRDRDEGARPDGRPYPDGRPDGGRWGDGRPSGGQLNAEPHRGNSLGEAWREQQDEAREGVRRGQLRPLGGVLSELRRRQPGRQLDAGIEEGPGGRPVYRVRWAAQNGRRIDYIVDARTGAILSEEGR